MHAEEKLFLICITFCKLVIHLYNLYYKWQTNLKSFRLDEDLIEKLDKDANFSNLANQALREYLNESVWLPNFQIHDYAHIAPKQLIERTANVQYLRQSESAISFTFYPTSEDEIKRNRAIFDYANGNFNALHDGYVYFNVKFPINFLFFLKSKSWEHIEKSINSYLAFLHWSDEDGRKHLEEQLERKTLRSVVKLTKSESFQSLTSKQKSYLKAGGGAKRRGEFNELYFRTLIELGIDPMLFPYVMNILRIVDYPFQLSKVISSKSSDFNVKLTGAYMRDVYDESDDWRMIVVKGLKKDDDLQRAESSPMPWRNWFDEYVFYHHEEVGAQAIRAVRKNQQGRKQD